MLNSFLKLAVANDPLCTGKGTSMPMFAADVLRDLETSRVHLSSEQLDQYLKILCDEKVVVVTMVTVKQECCYRGNCEASMWLP